MLMYPNFPPSRLLVLRHPQSARVGASLYLLQYGFERPPYDCSLLHAHGTRNRVTRVDSTLLCALSTALAALAFRTQLSTDDMLRLALALESL